MARSFFWKHFLDSDSVRRLHESAYKKEVEDEVEVEVSTVGDISPDKLEEYWEDLESPPPESFIGEIPHVDPHLEP
ncbi:hypothetical protein L2E82_19356 [Cichorium intybus]|uniref:Uncharacterized protein n=1 Tax=Cichorium intybus TaxID=13427 RepID=A0ACB9FBX9_CICIN|nr:hypothetical protein L2E82_19356 [Cichorium intybus]